MLCLSIIFFFVTGSSLAQSFITLASFDEANGANPAYSSLVQGGDGNFYGTTTNGGAHQSGSVFSVSPEGTLKSLYSFCARENCIDGATPTPGIILGADGNFYGITTGGGAGVTCFPACGTIFKVSLSGKLTTLYSFCPQQNCPDGSQPLGALVQATDGNFYGTTFSGGIYDYGTVFKITPEGTFTTVYSFCSGGYPCTDGSRPFAGLVQAGQSLYGTTDSGGVGNYGTVFKVSSAGILDTLYSFCSLTFCNDGAFPVASLIQASDGNLYGTTTSGGAHNGGTAFKVTASGVLITLYTFCSVDYPACTDGSQPYGPLIQATNGSLYGTTYQGGANSNSNCSQDPSGCGTVFEITSTGTMHTLYDFCSEANCSDGNSPFAGLFQGTNGKLYGTTSLGGSDLADCTDGCGTTFQLSLGLGSFVETNPVSGEAGSKVTILGNNLTGATAVSFNGTAATFTIVSKTEITTTVPAGATTGKIKVATTAKTLSSNVAFHVVP
jgi:uncharacterized repeat protein (TIGR03803 family)